jgi:hypothetical protein
MSDIAKDDAIAFEKLVDLIESCDLNNNGTLDACEIHACTVKAENNYRDFHCPDLGHLYCECPFDPEICIGSWDCDDIKKAREDFMLFNDSNNDG